MSLTATQLFRTLGGFLEWPGNVPVTWTDLYSMGYRWISPKIQHGIEFEYTRRDLHTTLDVVVNQLHNTNLKCVGWGFLTGEDATEEGHLAALLTNQYGLDGYIANAETSYMDSGYDNSIKFVTAFRSLCNKPLAVQSLGSATMSNSLPWAYAFNVKPWLDADADFMPESYWTNRGLTDGAAPWYKPFNCYLEWHIKLGVPVERIHPTTGIWNSSAFATADEYLVDLKNVSWRGFNHYTLEETSREALQVLAKGIGMGLADAEININPIPIPLPPMPTLSERTAKRRAEITALLDAQILDWKQSKVSYKDTRLGVLHKIVHQKDVDFLTTLKLLQKR